MKLFKHRRMVSIFQHYFKILSMLVLFCLLISSLSLMLLVASTWSMDLQKKLTDQCSFVADEFCAMHSDDLNNQSVAGLLSVINNFMNTTDSTVMIVDENGSVVLCSDMTITETGDHTFVVNGCKEHSQSVFSSDTLSNIKNEPLQYTHRGPIDIDDTQDYFLAATEVISSDGIEYYVFVTQLLSVGYQPYITQYLKMTIGASCVAVVMAFFSSLIVTYRIVRPLRNMAEATKHYATGDFSYRIRNVGRYEEFNELATAFNLMANNLEENEKTRKNFVANVSHELKTPMTTIGGFIDGILDGTIPPDEREHYLQIVSEVVKHLSGLIVSMLNMSKIEAGKVQLEYSEFLLDRLLIQVLVGFEKIITDKNIDIIGLDKIDSVQIRADEALLRQVIFNILDNAVKFTKENGSIKFEMTEEKRNVSIAIINTGSTIPEEDLTGIFDRFYKVDKSRGLDSSSFGIGLSIVKSIIEMHGGTIYAVSKDEITKFIINLPLFNND